MRLTGRDDQEAAREREGRGATGRPRTPTGPSELATGRPVPKDGNRVQAAGTSPDDLLGGWLDWRPITQAAAETGTACRRSESGALIAPDQ